MDKRKQNFGIKFPFTKENDDEIFLDLNQNFVDKAKSDMFHAVFTPKGQRLRMPDFGTNLIQFIFEENTQFTWDKIRDDISATVEKYVPSVKITDVMVYTECDDDHAAFVTLKFTVTNGISITDEQELTIKL
jgi:phage baseplate assembly protein W